MPYLTGYGMNLVGTVDGATFNFLVPLVTAMELIVVAYIYGIKNFLQDVSMMLGVKPGRCPLGYRLWKFPPIKWYVITT